ncbi:hypothetical protein DOFOFD_07980 [Acetobacteraceae bacterium EV16P]|uniref:Lipoyl-binding domain-containing protein n=1 Tax=Sorlinia euscelidii TaxID=3081148 RepID=A0ABU7U4X5_9PROT
MATTITMPALSPTMTEGRLARWVKQLGDRVQSGDVIAEIETDKATMEVEAVEDGILARLLVKEGTENVAVNAPIAILSQDGETVEDTLPEKAPPVSESATISAPLRRQPLRQVRRLTGIGARRNSFQCVRRCVTLWRRRWRGMTMSS